MSTRGSANISAAHAVMTTALAGRASRPPRRRRAPRAASTRTWRRPGSRATPQSRRCGDRRREREPAVAVRADPGESGARSEDQTRERDVAPVAALGMDRERAIVSNAKPTSGFSGVAPSRSRNDLSRDGAMRIRIGMSPRSSSPQVPRSRQCAPLARGTCRKHSLRQRSRDSSRYIRTAGTRRLTASSAGDRACGR